MTEEANSPVFPSAGSLTLRQAREGAGLQLGALAATLKVPPEYLQALEDGRYDELPNLTFARALAASVCRALKIDPAPVLQGLPQAGGVKLGSDKAIELDRFNRSRGGSLSSLRSFSLRAPFWIALLLLVAAVALWWWLPQRDRLSAQDGVAVAPAAEVVSETPPQSVSVGQQVESAPPVVPAPVAAPAVPDTPVVPASAPALPEPAAPLPPVVSEPAAAPAAAAPAAQPLLQLQAKDTTWVQIKNAAGKELQQRTLQPGQTLAFDGDLPLQLVLGRPRGVEVLVRGQAMDLSSYAANKAARIEIN